MGVYNPLVSLDLSEVVMLFASVGLIVVLALGFLILSFGLAHRFAIPVDLDRAHFSCGAGMGPRQVGPGRDSGYPGAGAPAIGLARRVAGPPRAVSGHRGTLDIGASEPRMDFDHIRLSVPARQIPVACGRSPVESPGSRNRVRQFRSEVCSQENRHWTDGGRRRGIPCRRDPEQF